MASSDYEAGGEKSLSGDAAESRELPSNNT